MDTFDLKKYLAENPLMKENEEEPQIKYGIIEHIGEYYSTINKDLQPIVFAENALVELEDYGNSYYIVDYILRGEAIVMYEDDQQIFDENRSDYNKTNTHSRDVLKVFDDKNEAEKIFKTKYQKISRLSI
jgi:hypothetical protein